jgi:hypothetical protein
MKADWKGGNKTAAIGAGLQAGAAGLGVLGGPELGQHTETQHELRLGEEGLPSRPTPKTRSLAPASGRSAMGPVPRSAVTLNGA